MDTPLDIRHDSAAQRFIATVDGHDCVCDYRLLPGGVAAFVHTVVPPAVGGRGIAAALVAHAMAWARAEDLKVDPRCSYVDAWLRRHPAWGDLRTG